MKWISVKEQLPKMYEDLLMLVNGNVDYGYYSDYGFVWNDYSSPREEDVTHWIYLEDIPKPTKE